MGGGTKRVKLYDPLKRTFSHTGNSQCGSFGRHAATVMNDGRVLITGGEMAASCAEIYDPDNAKFERIDDMQRSRQLHTSTVLDDRNILVVSGFERNISGGEVTVTSAEIFDISSKTFSLTGNLKTGRAEHSAFLMPDGTVVIVSGIEESVPGDVDCDLTPEIYSPQTGRFRALAEPYIQCQAAPMTQERLGYTATLLLDGSVLVTGGDDVDRKSQLSAEIWTSSSLISWWPADRNADDIAGINDGELEDDTIFARGVKGRAFSFDGDGDYVALPSQISLSNALTVSAWVKFSEDDFDNFQSIFSDGSITLIKNGLQEENVIDFDVRFSDGEGATTSSMTKHNPGEWIHPVGTFEGSSIAIYVNGELDNGAKIAGEIAPGKFEPRIGMGEPRGKTAAPFSGLIDELRIYDRALSAEEIKAQYEAGSSGL